MLDKAERARSEMDQHHVVQVSTEYTRIVRLHARAALTREVIDSV